MSRPFWIIASNIHTSQFQRYGPYTWPPRLTYDGLQSNIQKDQHFQIFGWHDPQDTGNVIRDTDGILVNEHGYDYWRDSDGEYRYDGWRENRQVIDKRAPDGLQFSHIEPVGPFWTDLDITLEPPPSTP